MRMRPHKEGSCDPVAPLELPHALHSFLRVPSTDSSYTVCGPFVIRLPKGELVHVYTKHMIILARLLPTQEYRKLYIDVMLVPLCVF